MRKRAEKWRFLMDHYDGRCKILLYNFSPAWDDPPTELHHAHAHDRSHLRKACPLFIDSVMNLWPVCERNHTRHRSAGVWSYERCVRAERFLERHPKIAHWVNNPEGELWK